jgi:endonuclease YncB( thermonuclease family)
MAGKTFGLWVEVFDWYDGDTFHGVLDHGCRLYRGASGAPERFRCALIDAPELHDDGGQAALSAAMLLAPPAKYPCVSTSLDTYGRPLLDLQLPNGWLFSAAMIHAGHAVPYKAK